MPKRVGKYPMAFRQMCEAGARADRLLVRERGFDVAALAILKSATHSVRMLG